MQEECGNINIMAKKTNVAKKVMKEFEDMKEMAELRALSKYSLEHPVNNPQYKRMMELKKKLFNIE